MVTKEEFGHLVSEFESLRDMVIEEITKIKTELETVKEDFEDLKRELESSAKISIKKRIG
mgnify:CR=1 FL=1